LRFGPKRYGGFGILVDDGPDQFAHFSNRLEALGGVLAKRLIEDRRERRRHLAEVGPFRLVLEENFNSRLAVERDLAGQHFIKDDSRRVNIDLMLVVAARYLRRHVMDGADALGL